LRVSDRYLMSLTFAYMLTTVSLSAYGENRLDLYVSLYILEYFLLTLAHLPFNPRTRKILNAIGCLLFIAFIIIIGSKVIEILSGASLW